MTNIEEVADQVRFKPACSATETSKKIEISLVARPGMMSSNKRIPKALIRLRMRSSRVEAQMIIVSISYLYINNFFEHKIVNKFNI